jgi:hypothetical protein
VPAPRSGPATLGGRDRPDHREPFTVVAVELLAQAKPWTYWMALPLVLAGVLGCLAVFVGYLVKVVAAKYPRQ